MAAKQPRSSRKVLSGSVSDSQYRAAMDFLDVVQHMFPDEWRELEDRARELDQVTEDETDKPEEDDEGVAREALATTVEQWAVQFNLGCDAIHQAAMDILDGLDWSRRPME